MNVRLSASALALALAMSACATPPPPSLPSQTSSGPPDVETSTREKTIVDLLAAGDVAAAKTAAQTLVTEQPANREGAVLLMEIEQDPKVMFGVLSFDVTAKPGDTFAGLAERYLHDRGLAYGLARYNGVAPPTQPVAGETVHIPGSPPRQPAVPPRRRERPRVAAPAPARRAADAAPEKPAAAKPAPVKPAAEKPAAEKPAAPPVVPKPAEPPKPADAPKPVEAPKPAEPRPASPAQDPAKAGALRSDALVLMNKGDIDRAVGLLRQATTLDPDNASIKADLERAVRIQRGPQPPGAPPPGA